MAESTTKQEARADTGHDLAPAHNGLASPPHLAIARRALEAADTLPDLAGLIDQAEVVRVVAQRAKLGRESQNDWAEFKLDAERKAGALLREMAEAGERAQRGGDRKSKFLDGTLISEPSLVDLGVADEPLKAAKRSHRWQLVAELPEVDYEQFKADARAKDKEITEAEAIRLAKHLRAEEEKRRLAAMRAAVAPAEARLWRAPVRIVPSPAPFVVGRLGGAGRRCRVSDGAGRGARRPAWTLVDGAATWPCLLPGVRPAAPAAPGAPGSRPATPPGAAPPG
ncbi:MAG: hypothetical protein ACRDI2_06965 [Chloroflexota bacterium]